MKLKTLKDMKCYWCEHHHGEERTVETCVCDHENFPSESLVSSRDLREEAKLWRDEIRTGDLIQMPQFKLWMKEIPTKWEHNANFIYGFEWGFQTALNHFFNLKEEGEE